MGKGNIRTPSIAIAMSLALCLCCGCAVFNRNNTPTVNWVDHHLMPKQKPAKYFVMPLILPVGIVAVAGDMFIVHPITVIGDALHDIHTYLWQGFDFQSEYVTDCLTLIPRSIATVVGFPFVFLARSSFDIDSGRTHYRGSAGESEAEKAQAAEFQAKQERGVRLTDEAGKALQEGRFDEAVSLADEAMKNENYQSELNRAIRLAALAKMGKTEEFISSLQTIGWVVGDDRTNEPIIDGIVRILVEGKPSEQMKLLYVLEMHYTYVALAMPGISENFAKLLKGDRAVAQKALEVLGRLAGNPNINGRDKAIEILQSVAKSSDPALAATASFYLTKPVHSYDDQ